jgi:pimeloyl-ACP methyl ester carboxylesterase
MSGDVERTPVVRSERAIEGANVSLLRAGEGDGPPLLLLHGAPTGADLWRPSLARLGRARAVAPDLPGYGHSQTPHNPSIGSYHRFIAAVAEAEGLERPVLVGHDLGGLYALTYALRHPRRLVGLALLNTTIYPDPWVALGLLPLVVPPFGEAYAWLAGRRRYAAQVSRDLRSMYPPETPPEVARRLVEPYTDTGAWLGLVWSLRGLNPPMVLAWKRRMRSLSVPTLILWGEGDPYFAPSVPLRLRRDIPGTRLRLLAGAGHFPMLSRPGETAEALRELVAGFRL